MPMQLARRLADTLRTPTPLGTCWAETEPIDLLEESEPRPRSFRQALSGLHVREVADDDLFHRYFGAPQHSVPNWEIL